MRQVSNSMIRLPLLMLCLFVGGCVFALPMGERQIADFEKETLRTLTELLCLPREESGDRVIYRLENQTIRETNVAHAVVEFNGLDSALFQGLASGKLGFDGFRKVQSVFVESRFRQEDVQKFLDQQIQRQKESRQVFNKLSIAFENGAVAVVGHVNLNKIPGNPLSFLSQEPSLFSARFALHVTGSHLTIDLLEGQVNGQPVTPELKTQVLSWLNPLWDFSKLPYETGIEEIRLSPGLLGIKGWLFSR